MSGKKSFKDHSYNEDVAEYWHDSAKKKRESIKKKKELETINSFRKYAELITSHKSN